MEKEILALPWLHQHIKKLLFAVKVTTVKIMVQTREWGSVRNVLYCMELERDNLCHDADHNQLTFGKSLIRLQH